MKYALISLTLGAWIVVISPAYSKGEPLPSLESQVETIAKEETKLKVLHPKATEAFISAVSEKIKSDYVEPITEDKILEGALNGMLGSLDTHSTYYNPRSFEILKSSIQGEFGGLGIEVIMDHGAIKVIAPIEDSPAFIAGLKPGDYIVAIDGNLVFGMTGTEAIEKLRGAPGTEVKLSVRREGSDPLELTIKRALIKAKSVKWRCEGTIGYIRISLFSETTTSDLKKAIADIKKQLGSDLQGFLLDFRNNPGGLLEQGIEVADLFLEKGEIVSIKGRKPGSEKHFSATRGEIAKGYPIAILINAGSASASEIVAGALQDHRRALILGTKSFGKGSVQVVSLLPNGGAIKLTTALYYTPSGHSIQKTGITPDVTVEQQKAQDLPEPDYIREKDYKHSLNAATSSGKQDSKTAPKPATIPSSKEQIEAQCAALKNKGPQSFSTHSEREKLDCDPTKDFQLLRALDILKGISVMQLAPKNKDTKSG